MKLFFYSSCWLPGDKIIDAVAAACIGKNGKLTFIPATSGPGGEEYYRGIQNIYRPLGVSHFDYLAVDDEFSDSALSSALSGDAIFLSGGNTFVFLKSLREKGLLPKLSEFARSGGVLIGQSAGAIIMTPCIDLAGIGRGADPNVVDLKELSALGLVTFEFVPHYELDAGPDEALERYSAANGRPIWCAPDQCGIAVRDGELTFFGDVRGLRGGSGYALGHLS